MQKQWISCFVLLPALLALTACDITFKRKSASAMTEQTDKQQQTDKNSKQGKTADGKKDAKKPEQKNKDSKPPVMTGKNFTAQDKELIQNYFKNVNNARVFHEAAELTRLDSKRKESLKVNTILSADIQVIPLPLELERGLSTLNSNMIRVQVENLVILMDLGTRRIVEIIKITL